MQFRFNAWGEKYSPYDRDADLPRQLAVAGNVRRYASPLVMEGGGFNVDGEGTLITTESVVLNANRNPGRTREECEDALRQATGAEKILWLEHGLAEDRDTDGHSDNVVQFAGPGRVVVQVAPDRSNPNWTPLRENLERLREATDAQGRRLEIIEIPQLPYTQEIDGTRYAVPYVNFYPVNGAIVVPRLDARRGIRGLQHSRRRLPRARDRRGPERHARLRGWRRGVRHPACSGRRAARTPGELR